MLAFLTRLQSDKFVRHNAVFFVGSLVVAFINYLYYPVLGRMMDPAHFGEVQLLVSMFLQAAIIFNVLGLVTVNVVANQPDPIRQQQIIDQLERLAFWLMSFLLLGSLVLAGWLQQFFSLESPWLFVITTLALFVSVPLSFRAAYLRGKQQFGVAAWSGVLGATVKLLLSVLLVAIGWRAIGALGGLAAAQLVALAYTTRHAGRLGFTGQGRRLASGLDWRLIRPELRYAGFVLLVSMIVTLQFSLDMIVVKRLFPAAEAGLYAGITTIARIIYFLTGSVSMVLLSSVQIKDLSGANRRLFNKAMLLLLALGGAALALFAAVPELVIRLMIGAKYLPYAYLLPRLSLAVFVVSAINLVLIYCLARRQYNIAGVTVAGAVATYGLIYLNHATISSVVDSLLYGSLLLAVLLGGQLGLLQAGWGRRSAR
jgi:O-antigen/teichoic acid export membrane protein